MAGMEVSGGLVVGCLGGWAGGRWDAGEPVVIP
jgi:hypothetical protein